MTGVCLTIQGTLTTAILSDIISRDPTTRHNASSIIVYICENVDNYGWPLNTVVIH